MAGHLLPCLVSKAHHVLHIFLTLPLQHSYQLRKSRWICSKKFRQAWHADGRSASIAILALVNTCRHRSQACFTLLRQISLQHVRNQATQALLSCLLLLQGSQQKLQACSCVTAALAVKLTSCRQLKGCKDRLQMHDAVASFLVIRYINNTKITKQA